VYSITDRKSFKKLKTFKEAVLRAKKTESTKPIFLLVGNKIDEGESERKVLMAEGLEVAQEFECDFFETSTKTSHNVFQVFSKVVRLIRTVHPVDLEPEEFCECTIM
jgi:GTPase SAR1 family protein